MSDKNDGLKSEAQGYGAGNYIKQLLHPKGLQRAVTEKVSPKYQERMETLREADKGMRETAKNLKGYLSNAQASFKDNRYLDVAHWCSQVSGAVRGMVEEGKPVVDLRDAEIAEFYTRYEDAEPDHEYFKADDGLVSTAGILDRLFGNSIEKLYWKKVKESKLAVQSLIKRAERLVAIVLSSLERMGDARAKGNISAWIEDLQRMGNAQSEFQVFARGVYEKHLKQLADIVKANRPKPVQPSAPAKQIAPEKVMPSADKAEEAEELVEEKPVEIPAKKEPGRPTVDQAAKKKEMEQIEQLQKALNNPPVVNEVKPEVPVVEAPKMEEPKAIPASPSKAQKITQQVVPTIPDIAPKVEPKVEPIKEPVRQEVPKAVLPAPKNQVKAPAPAPILEPILEPTIPDAQIIPQEPVQMAPEAISAPIAPPPGQVNRPRGRPRKNPLPESAQLQTAPKATKPAEDIVVPEPLISRVKKDEKPSVFPDLAPKNITPKDNGPKNITPKDNAPDDKANKEERSINLNKSEIEKPEEGTDKKITLVLLPKIIPDDLDAIQYSLMKQLGHPVKFVSLSNGREKAKEYHDAGWDIQPMEYSEVEKIIADKADPLKMLDDDKFVSTLPRLGNGDFHLGSIIDNKGQPDRHGNSMDKYPEFNEMPEDVRKAVIAKFHKIRDNEVANPGSATEPKKEKPEETKPAEVKPEETTPSEVTPDEVSEPKNDEVSNEPEPTEDEIDSIGKPSSEEEDEMAIYVHTGELEKMLKKKVPQINKNDIMHLLSTKEYIASLPRNKDKTFNFNLISKFPEFKIMQDGGMKSKFLSVLQNKEKVEQREKAAYSVDDAMIKLAHSRFFTELQKVANIEDHGLMAAMMCAYSEEIENIDPVMSIKLIRAAEKLI